ncbi:MAG: TRAP transporter small permease, partial [Dehalococcoidia bacterium]
SFEKFVTGSSKCLNLVAGFALTLMVIIVVADICGNKFFKTPVPGGIELVSLLSVIAISFAIAQTQLEHGHIEVEMLVTKFPQKVQKVISVIVYLFCITLFIILAVRSFKYGISLQRSGEVTMTMGLPFYPFVWAMGLSAIVVTLVLIMQLFQKLREK